jgi:hypothetical protein
MVGISLEQPHCLPITPRPAHALIGVANMASMSTGNTPTITDDVSKPPDGVVLPPKDIRG